MLNVVYAVKLVERIGAVQIWQWITEHWVLSAVMTLISVILMIALYDVLQQRHTIMHNFPVVGHLRYLLEMIGPEIRQYFIAQDKEELPFSRDERSWIYSTAKGTNNTFGFGTNEQVYGVGYPVIKHAAFPIPDHTMKFPNGDKSWCPSLSWRLPLGKPFPRLLSACHKTFGGMSLLRHEP